MFHKLYFCYGFKQGIFLVFLDFIALVNVVGLVTATEEIGANEEQKYMSSKF